MENIKLQNTNDLLDFLVKQSDARKDWFGFVQQKMTAINLAHAIAAQHANVMTPDEVVSYAKELTELLYHKVVKPGAWRFVQ
jgi:hypothetical protein